MNNFLLFLSMILFICIFGLKASDKKDKIVHCAINNAVIEIQKKYELQLAGIAEAADHDNNKKYKTIGFSLSSRRYFSKNEARKIVIDISKIILDNLNKSNVLPYLTVNPFTIENIQISITFAIAKKNRDYSQVAFTGMNLGKLYYWYKIPETEFGLREDKEETYEEALKIIEFEEKEFK